MDSWVPPDTTFDVALRPYLLLAAFYSFVPLIVALRLARTGADAMRRRHRVPAADMPRWLHIDAFMCAVMAVNLVLWVATAQGTIDWEALRMDVANSLSVSITLARRCCSGACRARRGSQRCSPRLDGGRAPAAPWRRAAGRRHIRTRTVRVSDHLQERR